MPRYTRHTSFDDGTGFSIEMDLYPNHGGGDCNRCTSPASPTNLNRSRSHAALSGRREASLDKGVSFNEPLETRDHWNWK